MVVKIPKLDTASFLLAILIVFFVFQRALIGISSIFGYADEAFALCAIFYLFIRIAKRQLDKKDVLVVCLMALLIFEGLLSNFISKLLGDWLAIFTDAISTVKVLVAFVWMKNLKFDSDGILKLLAVICRAVVWIMAFCFLLSLVVDIGMTDGTLRYGMRPFRFVFDNAGNYSKMFYFLVPVLLVDLKFESTPYKKFMIVFACVMWATSLRSRAFAFIAMVAVFAFLFFKKKKNKKKFPWLSILLLALLVFIICWEQFVFYFTDDNQTRGILLRYSFVTMGTYFPIGSGFGTYGSDVAVEYYSELYKLYGFESIYGMGDVHTGYLNDNYWPMIFGQFGVIGTIIVVAVLFLMHKDIIQNVIHDKYLIFATLCAMLFLFFSSIASKSYSEFSSIAIFLLFGVLYNNGKKRKQGVLR